MIFNKKYPWFAVFLSLMLIVPAGNAQNDSGASSQKERYVCVTTVAQIMRCGYLKDDNGREITLETSEMGTVILPKSDLISIEDADEGTRSQSLNSTSLRGRKTILNPNRSPQSSRYFFAPSALPMELGEGYTHVNPLLANVTGQVGEDLMLGGALSWVGVGGTMKLSVPINDNSHFALGAMGLIGFYDLGPTFFPFVNFTNGNHNNHRSIAFAALMFDGDISPMVNVSACWELSPRSWLITENYYFSDPMLFNEQILLSIGGRWWQNNQNRLGEFALMMMVTEDNEAIPIPWFGATWPF